MLAVEKKNTVVPFGPKKSSQFLLAFRLGELLVVKIGHSEKGQVRDESELVGR